MMCAESLRVQAYFDGELDAIGAADVERHAGLCASCAALLRDLGATRAALRGEVGLERAPGALYARIALSLDGQAASSSQPPPRTPPPWSLRAFWTGAASGIAAVGATAALVVLLLLPARADRIADELASAHLHSLLPSRLIAVESSDRHTVKPWFAGRSDVSPAVADFAADGYALAGGRVDTVNGQRAAVLAYRHGPHVINVFCWQAGGSRLPRDRDIDGYHLIFWQTGDLAYGAVSDTGIGELRRLEALLRE